MADKQDIWSIITWKKLKKNNNIHGKGPIIVVAMIGHFLLETKWKEKERGDPLFNIITKM